MDNNQPHPDHARNRPDRWVEHMIGDNLEQADRKESGVGRYACADHRLQMFTDMIGRLDCGAEQRD